MCSESTSSLEQEKLARLLRIGNEEERSPIESNANVSDSDKVDMFWEMLTVALPSTAPRIESVPEIIRRACIRPWAQQGAFSLADPGLGLAAIRGIKEQAKILAQEAGAGPRCEVATVLYFTAIASALVFHSTAITKSSSAKLRRSFSDLRAMTWLPEDIVKLLDRASETCDAQNASAPQDPGMKYDHTASTISEPQ